MSEKDYSDNPDGLVSWVMSRVDEWETHRDTNFKDKWDEYYRLWRGVWTEADKSRQSERSKLISPATQQAVEATVAELEEATFGRGRWIDVSDDIADEEKNDVAMALRQLLEDYELSKVPSAVTETFLNGALYGTGIAKIVVDVENIPTIESAEIPGTYASRPEKRDNETVVIKVVPIEPTAFVIDPSARNIDEALGCAHVLWMPRHLIIEKQQQGFYRDEQLGDSPDRPSYVERGELRTMYDTDDVKIVEYHGKVPASLLVERDEDEENTDEPLDNGETSDTDLVEAIITICNDSVVLKASENPYLMGDRSIIAYQHDTVPNRFWGRGVVEKGYNPQKALDAELRARMDTLAMSTFPMLAIDATAIPRGESFQIRPGKNIFLNGDPNAAIREFKFTSPDLQTYRWTGDLERMIQMGTGAMDSATPVGVSPRNQTASGMSMIVAGMVKRTKRSMQNIERQFLDPMVRKSLWRYMQFAPDRYPVQDYKFVVHSTMGIMAREFEQTQLTQLLSTVPPASPAYWLLLKSIYTNSSMTDKEEMLAVIDQMTKQAMQPQQQPQDLTGQARMVLAQVEQARLQMESMERDKRLQLEQFDRVLKNRELDIKERELVLESQRVAVETQTARADSILSIAKAEAQELGSQLEQYKAVVDGMMRERDGKVEALDKIIEYQKGLAAAQKPSEPSKSAEGAQVTSYDDSELRQMMQQLLQQRGEAPQSGMMEGQGNGYDEKFNSLQQSLAGIQQQLAQPRDSGPIRIELKRLAENGIE